MGGALEADLARSHRAPVGIIGGDIASATAVAINGHALHELDLGVARTRHPPHGVVETTTREVLLERQRIGCADDDARGHHAGSLPCPILGREGVVDHLLVADIGLVGDGDGRFRYLVYQREVDAHIRLFDLIDIINNIGGIDITSMLARRDGTPGEGDGGVVLGLLDMGGRLGGVETDINLYRLALASCALGVFRHDGIGVEALVGVGIGIVVGGGGLEVGLLPYLLAIAEDGDGQGSLERGTVDGFLRGSETEGGLRTAVGSGGDCEVGHGIGGFLGLAHDGDIVEEELVAPVGRTGTMESEVIGAVGGGDELLAHGLVLIVGDGLLRNNGLGHGLGGGCGAGLHLQQFGKGDAHTGDAVGEVVDHAGLQRQRGCDDPVVVIDLAVLDGGGTLSCGVAGDMLPGGSVAIGIEDREALEGTGGIEALGKEGVGGGAMECGLDGSLRGGLDLRRGQQWALAAEVGLRVMGVGSG